MADLRIVDAPVILQESIADDVKMPTGGLGNFSIRLGDIVWYVVTKEQLANKNYVDLSSQGVKDSLDAHIADTNNPHQVTKEQVGLGNVDNTADLDKPVSDATSAAIITATTDMATKAYVNSRDGDLATLTTTDKTSLVKAINEVDANLKLTEVVTSVLNTTLTTSLNNGSTSLTDLKPVVDNVIDSGIDATKIVYINRSQYDKNRESFCVYDFFTREELTAYKASPTTFDAARPVQEFFDYIHNNDVGVAYATGKFYTSKNIVWGNGTTDSKTKTIFGNFNLCVLGTPQINALLEIKTGRYCTWIGRITVTGNGGIYYASRTVDIGIKFGGSYSSAHFTVTGGITADGGFKQIGILLDNLNTATNIGVCNTTRCGSGFNYADYYSIKANFTNRIDVSSAGASQQSTITVDTLPPGNLVTPLIIGIDGVANELHYVTAIDRANNTITVTPLIDTTKQTGTLRYVFGAGIYVTGADTSLPRILKSTSTNNSVNLWAASLYLPIVDNLTAESNGIGLVVGSSLTSAAVGGQINGIYIENNDFDIVKLTRTQISLPIIANYALNLDKYFSTGALRDPTTNKISSYNQMVGFSIVKDNGFIAVENDNSNSFIDVTSVNRAIQTFFGTTKTFTIVAPNQAYVDKFGLVQKRIQVVRASSDGIPTGAVTFNAPTGYTINGGTNTVTFNGFARPPIFDIIYNADKSFIVRTSDLATTAQLKASVTYDPPSLATATQQSTTVALTGAKLGDNVSVSFNKVLNGTRMWAEVTATDTVTVYHRNDTGASVDIASGTLTVKIV